MRIPEVFHAVKNAMSSVLKDKEGRGQTSRRRLTSDLLIQDNDQEENR
jgi:hypothetical protein